MTAIDRLTVVVARRDPWISAEFAVASVGSLAPVIVVDRPVDEIDGRACSAPGAWTLPASGGLAWAAREALVRVDEGWVLLMEADERLTPTLAEEIRRCIAGPPEVGAYRLSRQQRFLGRDLRAARRLVGVGLRLGRVDQVTADPAGDGFVSREDVASGELVAPLVHDAFASLEDCMARLDFEASREARWLAGVGAGTSLRTVVLGPFGSFLRRWIVGGAILDGTLGLVQAAFEGAFDVVRTAKLWELGMPARLRRVPSLPEPPP